MDPDKALAQLLGSARAVLAGSRDPRALKVAEGVLDLHEWIRKGGFLPKVWQPPASAVSDQIHDPGRSGL